MDQGLPPPPHQTPRAADPRRTTGDSASSTAGMSPSLGIWTATVWDCSSLHNGPFATEYLPLLYGRVLRYSLVIATSYNNSKMTICFVMNIGCASRGPTIHVVCVDLLLFYCYFAFVLLCALHLLLCVCVSSVRGAARRTALAVCACGGALCAAPVCFSLFHLCVGAAAGLCVCVCLLPWIGVCVVRGVRRTVHAWLLPSPHVACPLCVSAAPLVSPVALHVPHCADQLHTTE
ncbi:mucin TcMUCII [Trypanosoma cruzi]|nr:mucin TcMUCII [Trypanosoma cruzi]